MCNEIWSDEEIRRCHSHTYILYRIRQRFAFRGMPSIRMFSRELGTITENLKWVFQKANNCIRLLVNPVQRVVSGSRVAWPYYIYSWLDGRKPPEIETALLRWSRSNFFWNIRRCVRNQKSVSDTINRVMGGGALITIRGIIMGNEDNVCFFFFFVKIIRRL